MTAGERQTERQRVLPEGHHSDDDVVVGRSRRRRRSTVGWLQTALRMCEMGFTSVDSRCSSIEVDDGRMRMTITLRDQ